MRNDEKTSALQSIHPIHDVQALAHFGTLWTKIAIALVRP